MSGQFRDVIYPSLKRAMDVTISAIFIVFLIPVFLLTFVAVKMTSKGPAFFCSDRVGRNGKVFRMPKFRSMSSGSKVMSREAANIDDISFTPIGNFLRKTSIDEIPQLWSVLKGDMSLIGPRPLLPNDQASEIRKYYPEIYSMRPGITGLAQVNGRSFISPRNKTRYDSFYSQRACMLLDTRIMMCTVRVIFNPRNVL